MLTLFSNHFTFLTLISISLCQGFIDDEDREKCTLKDDYTVLNENGAEVNATVLKTNNQQDDGYYNFIFSEGQLQKNGNIKAWCVDIARNIEFATYSVDVFNSMDADLFTTEYPDAVDYPEYIPAINWLMNNCNSGTEINVEGCAENHIITDRQFQLAVWRLVDNVTEESDQLNDFFKNEPKQCVVNHLVEKAKDFKDYKVDCKEVNEIIGLIVIVDDEAGNIQNQVAIMEVLLAETDLCDCKDPAVFGDPHFKTWAGEFYDFHGVCDLVLIKNPEFENGLGMDIHLRTTRTRMWSYVSSAAIRIGEDILEVIGGPEERKLLINGVPEEISNANRRAALMPTLSGYPINFNHVSKKQREIAIDLGEGEMIVFKTWNSFVSVQVKHGSHTHFQSSAGLMGSFPSGLKLARDNTSVIDDLDIFGEEWQVLSSEPKLFHNIEGPQHPNRCQVPSKTEMRRRLAKSTVTLEDAKKACANMNNDMMDLCVFDVIATGDESIVGVY